MAIARLLLLKSELRFCNRGFVRSTRWSFCSSSAPGDGCKNDTVSDLEASAKMDTTEKRGPWYPWEGILTNIKQKLLGFTRPAAKATGDDLGSTSSAKSSEVSAEKCSSGDTAAPPASEVVNLPKSSEETKCDSLSLKESSGSEVISQRVGECASGIEISQPNEGNISVKTDRLKNNLDGLELTQNKALELVSSEKPDLPKEPRSDDDSLPFLVSSLLNEACASRTLGKSQQKLHPKIGQTCQKKSPWIKTEGCGKNLDSGEESSPLLMPEALGKTSRIYTGEFRSGVTFNGDQKDQYGTVLLDSSEKRKSRSKAKDGRFPELSQKAKLLDSLLKGRSHDQTGGEEASRESLSMALLEGYENTNGLKGGSSEGVTVGLRNLLDCVKLIPYDNFKDTERSKPLPNVNFQNPETKRSESELKSESVSDMITSDGLKDEENENAETLFTVQNGSVCSDATVASSVKKKEAKKSSSAFSAELADNTVLVRFLHQRVKNEAILNALGSPGNILDVQEAAASEGCIYRDALVTFGKSTAFKKALQKTDVTIRNCDVVVEATSPEDMVDRVSIPNLIGDPDVPVALVKKPTRTVKIQPLAHGIYSSHVKEAFAFCGSNICSFFLGSSSSCAFVEFETEDAKERAIAKHSINIAGKQLFITRIDIPRTTVVRFSNLSKEMWMDLTAICQPHGQIKKMVRRSETVCDAYFKLAEWPKMLNILNSLNGKEKNGKKFVAQPSPVVPPEILCILWEKPQGKRYVKEVIKRLLRNLELCLDREHINRVASEFL